MTRPSDPLGVFQKEERSFRIVPATPHAATSPCAAAGSAAAGSGGVAVGCRPDHCGSGCAAQPGIACARAATASRAACRQGDFSRVTAFNFGAVRQLPRGVYTGPPRRRCSSAVMSSTALPVSATLVHHACACMFVRVCFDAACFSTWRFSVFLLDRCLDWRSVVLLANLFESCRCLIADSRDLVGTAIANRTNIVGDLSHPRLSSSRGPPFY